MLFRSPGHDIPSLHVLSFYGMSANNVQAGVNNIFRVTVIISMAGFFLVIFVVRKQLSGNEKAK